MAIGGLSAVVTNLTETALVLPVARHVERRRVGLLNVIFPSPRPRRDRSPAREEGIGRALTRRVLGFLFLDYTLWIWHWLNHRVRFLWRFHLVHHVDLDLDASTGIRFHFGEMALSAIYRIAQVRFLGVDSTTLIFWERSLLASVVFHHSNLRLPRAIERVVVSLIVTPRMHGIHHSIVPAETGSNFASLATCWDRLHGTLRLDVPQAEITIGVPAYQDPRDVTLPAVLSLPCREQRDDWRLPDGRIPARGTVTPGGGSKTEPDPRTSATND
jgi:hypothetical protein